jgi:hypothetical protein
MPFAILGRVKGLNVMHWCLSTCTVYMESRTVWKEKVDTQLHPPPPPPSMSLSGIYKFFTLFQVHILSGEGGGGAFCKFKKYITSRTVSKCRRLLLLLSSKPNTFHMFVVSLL